MNEKNLMPIEEVNSRRTREEHSEDSRKAGIASGKARKERRTTQKILSDLVNMSATDIKQISSLARKMGVESDKNVHEIFTLVALLNTMKKAKLSDLEQLSKLLGEDKSGDSEEFNTGMQTLADLINNPAPNRNISDFEGDEDV